MKLINNFLIFTILFLASCTLEQDKIIKEHKIIKEDKITKKNIVTKSDINNKKEIQKETRLYILEDPYYIEGVEYIPKEDYNYTETGLASFYGAELHRKKTVNNEYNKVTELLARHKTLPLPSVVKITNLENGLSLIVRINDRGPQNNVIIIEVSRKVAQLLRFYKSKIAKVKLEILVDPSKQLKIVTQSMSDSDFDNTLNAVPTEEVEIIDLDSSIEEDSNLNTTYEQPIELGFEEVPNTELFIQIEDFESYQDAQNLKNLLKETYKITTQKENEGYSIILGPISYFEADNLIQILVSKGYKHSKIIIK